MRYIDVRECGEAHYEPRTRQGQARYSLQGREFQ
jgi:hypothetical protein